MKLLIKNNEFKDYIFSSLLNKEEIFNCFEFKFEKKIEKFYIKFNIFILLLNINSIFLNKKFELIFEFFKKIIEKVFFIDNLFFYNIEAINSIKEFYKNEFSFFKIYDFFIKKLFSIKIEKNFLKFFELFIYLFYRKNQNYINDEKNELIIKKIKEKIKNFKEIEVIFKIKKIIEKNGKLDYYKNFDSFFNFIKIDGFEIKEIEKFHLNFIHDYEDENIIKRKKKIKKLSKNFLDNWYIKKHEFFLLINWFEKNISFETWNFENFNLFLYEIAKKIPEKIKIFLISKKKKINKKNQNWYWQLIRGIISSNLKNNEYICEIIKKNIFSFPEFYNRLFLLYNNYQIFKIDELKFFYLKKFLKEKNKNFKKIDEKEIENIKLIFFSFFKVAENIEIKKEDLNTFFFNFLIFFKNNNISFLLNKNFQISFFESWTFLKFIDFETFKLLLDSFLIYKKTKIKDDKRYYNIKITDYLKCLIHNLNFSEEIIDYFLDFIINYLFEYSIINTYEINDFFINFFKNENFKNKKEEIIKKIIFKFKKNKNKQKNICFNIEQIKNISFPFKLFKKEKDINSILILFKNIFLDKESFNFKNLEFLKLIILTNKNIGLLIENLLNQFHYFKKYLIKEEIFFLSKELKKRLNFQEDLETIKKLDSFVNLMKEKFLKYEKSKYFKNPKTEKKIIKNINQYILKEDEKIKEYKNIFILTGLNGIGKSFIMNKIFNELIKNHSKNVEFGFKRMNEFENYFKIDKNLINNIFCNIENYFKNFYNNIKNNNLDKLEEKIKNFYQNNKYDKQKLKIFLNKKSIFDHNLKTKKFNSFPRILDIDKQSKTFSTCSDGEKSILTLFALFDSSQKNNYYFWDESSIYLSPETQNRIFHYFLKNKINLFMITHSPFFMIQALLNSENCYIFEMEREETNNNVQFKLLNEDSDTSLLTDMNISTWILKYIKYHKFFFILFCEGSIDEQYLNLIKIDLENEIKQKIKSEYENNQKILNNFKIKIITMNGKDSLKKTKKPNIYQVLYGIFKMNKNKIICIYDNDKTKKEISKDKNFYSLPKLSFNNTIEKYFLDLIFDKEIIIIKYNHYKKEEKFIIFKNLNSLDQYFKKNKLEIFWTKNISLKKKIRKIICIFGFLLIDSSKNKKNNNLISEISDKLFEKCQLKLPCKLTIQKFLIENKKNEVIKKLEPLKKMIFNHFFKTSN